jgi:AcrR family transcriptional regulator
VYVLFGSKEELQLATVDAARASFVREVVMPALAAGAPGLAQLRALCDQYLSYVERRVFPGGCFFVAASAELGARPGRVHDRVARYQQEWRDLLEHEARAAQRAREIRDADPAQLAFELGAILTGADVVSVLHGDETAIARARTAIRSRLESGQGPAALDPR